MSRLARRKTLSHSEIESFLNDISVSNKISSTEALKPRNALTKSNDSCNEPWYNDEDFCGIDLMACTKAITNSRKVPTIEAYSEIQSIRDFCKVF